MRAVVVSEFAVPPEVHEVEDPTCPPDGVVVDVRATGLCRSDWHVWSGHDPDARVPLVPGHELAGVVLEVGADVRRVRVGDRVTVPFVCACGECRACREGSFQVCEDQWQPGLTGWGSFAERVALPRADLNVVLLPDEVEHVAAAALGCRFATAYRAVRAQGRVGEGDDVVVYGAGGVGLSAVMIAASLGARVIAVDLSGTALDLARELGAVDTLRSGTDTVEQVRDLTDGGATVAIDAVGSSDTCRAGIESLRPRGRHVQVGLMLGPDASASLPMDRVIAGELEVLGSHGMSARDYGPMLADVAAGRLEPARLVSGHLTLHELARPDGALARMSTASPVGVQVVLPDAGRRR